eukprot:260543_1
MFVMSCCETSYQIITHIMSNTGTIHSLSGFGACAAIVIVGFLMYSMVNTFKQQGGEIKKEIARITIFAFFCYLLWDVFIVLNQIIISRDLCTVRVAFGLPPFLLTRAALYYFFVLRTELSFAGSPMAFSPTFIKSIKVMIVAVFSISALYFIVSGQFQTFEDGVCVPVDSIASIQAIVYTVYGVTDFGVGVFPVVIYLHRLHKLNKKLEVKQLEQTQNNESKKHNSTGSVGSDRLSLIIKKQSKLAFVSFLTTVVFVYGTTFSPYFFMFMYVDGVANALCVYCTFEANSVCYEYLCNCNGNKCLQLGFCFCCYCCNTKKMNQDDERMLEVDVKSDTSAKGSQNKSSTTNSNKSSVVMELH